MHSLLHVHSGFLDLFTQNERPQSPRTSDEVSRQSSFRTVPFFTSFSAHLFGRVAGGRNGAGSGREERGEGGGCGGFCCCGLSFGKLSSTVSMSSLVAAEDGTAAPSAAATAADTTAKPGKASDWLRAGWIFHKQAILGKMWRKKWVTLAADGTLTVANQTTSRRRGRQKYQLRQDCMYIRTAGQCQHLHPPSEVGEKANLIELLLTGDRRVALCGLSLDDSQQWLDCIEKARSDVDGPRTIVTSNNFTALDDIKEERSIGPTTKQSSHSSTRKQRRVSWSKHVILIEE
ncbi:uncharacterized protein LOC143287315 isoform X2 [Babylonia areolata]|uniref:uncharacterized protein LOC143287315 isoform X2 n=1 Tax=Babylonia areolata TaxID=304850 RepID=UPI003FD3F1E0